MFKLLLLTLVTLTIATFAAKRRLLTDEDKQNLLLLVEEGVITGPEFESLLRGLEEFTTWIELKARGAINSTEYNDRIDELLKNAGIPREERRQVQMEMELELRPAVLKRALMVVRKDNYKWTKLVKLQTGKRGNAEITEITEDFRRQIAAYKTTFYARSLNPTNTWAGDDLLHDIFSELLNSLPDIEIDQSAIQRIAEIKECPDQIWLQQELEEIRKIQKLVDLNGQVGTISCEEFIRRNELLRG